MSNSPFYVVIPARLGSSRLPRKPLADIAGKPMVVRVAEQAKKSNALRVVVAADSEEIISVCKAHQIDALLTKAEHATGTDRIAEVVQILELDDDAIIVNVQGDEPLIPVNLINQVAQTLIEQRYCSIATVAVSIQDTSELNNPNVVKVVLNKANEAQYFSRSVIPFNRDSLASINYLRHLGIYAYRANFLKLYNKISPSPLEISESLEQLRALWHGYRIAVIQSAEIPPAGVDTPEDLERVRSNF
jgi:3-deoxy-manno-octulosonate cytidylyltransferase (CMP-KDO synthetase)